MADFSVKTAHSSNYRGITFFLQKQGQYMKLELKITNNHSSIIDNQLKGFVHFVPLLLCPFAPTFIMQNKPNLDSTELAACADNCLFSLDLVN
jgi:hypothetical protein